MKLYEDDARSSAGWRFCVGAFRLLSILIIQGRHMRLVAVLALVSFIAITSESSAQDVEYLTTEAAREAGFPFSEAVRVGDMLYLSGAIGLVPGTGKLAEGGIQAETQQTMENIRATLERYGSSMDSVVRCLVMLADMDEWGQMNEVYRTFFGEHFPARSALGATGLALGARVEIECTATVE